MQNKLLKIVLTATISISLNSCILATTTLTAQSPQPEYSVPERNIYKFKRMGRNFWAFDLDNNCRIDALFEYREGSSETLTNGQRFYNLHAHRIAKGSLFAFKRKIHPFAKDELDPLNLLYRETCDTSQSNGKPNF